VTPIGALGERGPHHEVEGVVAPGPEASVRPPSDRSERKATGRARRPRVAPGSRFHSVTSCGLRVANRVGILPPGWTNVLVRRKAAGRPRIGARLPTTARLPECRSQIPAANSQITELKQRKTGSGSVHLLHDQSGRLIGVVVSFANHAERSLAEMDRVAGAPVRNGRLESHRVSRDAVLVLEPE
jgi:hypothetical protein